MWCLEYNFDERPQDLQTVVKEIEEYLEGTKERERQRREAEKLIENAKHAEATLDALKKEAASLLDDGRLALRGVRPFDDVSKKRPAWEIEVREKQVELEI